MLAHVTGCIDAVPGVWSLYAAVQQARGKAEEAHACRLRHCRGLMQAQGWAQERGSALEVVRASCALQDSFEALALVQGGAGLETAMAAQLQARTVLAQLEAGLSSSASAAAEAQRAEEEQLLLRPLRQCLQRAQAAEQAALQRRAEALAASAAQLPA